MRHIAGPRRSRIQAVAAIVVAAAGGASLVALAGPLDPPSGPVGSTFKTLAEIEPRIALSAESAPGDAVNLFRIGKPGSYYLTGDIKGVQSKTGILVSASRVTLDLNGYALEGVSGAVDGIRVATDHGVTIRNGSVYNWRHGVDAKETSGVRLEGLTSARNSLSGFNVGPGAIVAECVAMTCNPGFDVFGGATLARCEARGGGGRGFDIGEGSTLSDCVASGVVTGFYIAGAAVLDNCASSNNSSHGFHAAESAVLSDCSAYGNSSAGFLASARSRMTRCHARHNIDGFYIVEGNSMVECTAATNSGAGLTISGNANTVERSTFHENGGEGIYLFSGRGNNIDGNLATYNALVGIEINDSDNLTVRNRARGNPVGNYSFVGNTDYGVVLTNPGQGFTSSAAWANFEY